MKHLDQTLAVYMAGLALRVDKIESVRFLPGSDFESSTSIKRHDRLDINMLSGRQWTIRLDQEGVERFWNWWQSFPAGLPFSLKEADDAAIEAGEEEENDEE